MESREQILLEAKIAGDIEDFFNLNELAQFDSEEEINDSLERASNLGVDFRHIHTELRLALPNYADNYPNYEKNMGELRSYVKEGRLQLERLREKLETDRKEIERVKHLEVKQEKLSILISERTFFLSKVDRKINSYQWAGMHDINEINPSLHQVIPEGMFCISE